MIAWDVYLGFRCIDTVFWNEKADGGGVITAEDIRRSLINHDGYDYRIIVKKVK